MYKRYTFYKILFLMSLPNIKKIHIQDLENAPKKKFTYKTQKCKKENAHMMFENAEKIMHIWDSKMHKG